MRLPTIELYVGSHSSSVRHGGPINLEGPRCFSAAYLGKVSYLKLLRPERTCVLLDSGAFSDCDRLSPSQALARQLAWEAKARAYWGDRSWRVFALSSYDYLIDEMWIEGCRRKRRWSERDAIAAKLRRRTGARESTWQANVAWWRSTLEGLRGSPYYMPPRLLDDRQLSLSLEVAV